MNIVLGITAGIAAYKTPQLVRLLTKNGHNVKVILTENAKEFVTPLTLSTVSKNPVLTSFSSPEGNWHSHVELALWADAMLIAPATANTVAKMAHGVCDNLLLATYFSAKTPVFVAPAMDLDMYAHPTVAENLAKLASYGNHIIPATYGELASGLVGQGRMADPEDIVLFIENTLSENLPLKGKKILITAGPTYEAIDPVRFIGNFSSGKMGIALANEAIRQGAEVHLVLGPSSEKNIHSQIHLHRVVSAQQMYEAAVSEFSTCDIAILSAAVVDYTPEIVAPEKIKKKGGNLSLTLVPTVDILASLGKIKTTQTLIGFALETENEVANAQTKLEKKNLNGIVLNSLRDAGAGFGTDTNKVTFITKEKQISFPLKSKEEVAKDILAQIFGILIEK
ncbi:phosphopantothenoylcysteine decarboxylase/phosphopantothenate/cysteine ligase [Capnocytophaga ochracea DSM 7271]|uniref:Coenzyme A biosynthesis bifunctional protein CoaBC n=1 Tax=Capnocytophaga ochracea (strain ATCC 27872 / DSM 7271 / CCUG 9716 / JCM 12966 / NCTC 12371 / SS31 / VPI 2845) TaxID=521097 RepID=C7M6S0_CAPOD|nr:bifunctional phosphopantothenoylcysteine decarboxylase/phosphopantothenate--cysteine ligase CoaBC [Capnocytophaga ochracea]ACU93046.1 phosphopantothenoylcysteine decarboxylase/phosphopantothenate/cysteine ligase [Capnocytophaga ochracea DSM 7271]UAK51745.1 bifunctional phosphopantothenoylcysteine decarboxylase/phosphopantothenate--cysteine ligase CoaBC [Capnocytophaga ochracea]